jgi:thiazole/oxazole-forming peptide maturase SagC family component
MATGAPRISPHWTVVPHGANNVECRFGIWSPTTYLLRDDSSTGTLYRIIRSLDGTKTESEIAAEHGLSREALSEIIGELDSVGILTRGPVSSLDLYLNEIALPLGKNPDATLRPLIFLGDHELISATRQIVHSTFAERAPISNPSVDSVALLNDLDTDWLYDALEFERNVEAFAGWGGHCIVLLSRGVNPLIPKILNRVARRLRIPWLNATLDGPFIYIGPLTNLPWGSCYECFETRVLMNLRNAESYVRFKSAFATRELILGTPLILPAVDSIVCALTAFEIMNFQLTGRCFTQGKVLSIHLPTMETAFNDVLQMPGCPGCGSVAGRDDEALSFDISSATRLAGIDNSDL